MPTSYNDRKFRLKDAVVAASLANLCFISTWFAFLYDKDFGYFNQQRVTPANLLALLLNLLVFSLLFWFGARALRRAPPHWVRVGAALGILACLVAPVEFFRLFILDIPDHAVLALVRNPIHLAAILVLLGLIVRWPRSVTRLVRPLLVLISPMAAYTVGKSLLLLCHLQTLAQNSEADTPLAQLQSGPPPTRVVWMIFDEMDQRLSFRARPANLKLPEFDRLCAVSLCASNAYPPGGNTLVSIPALLTGKVFSIGQPRSSDDLLLTSMESDRQVRWSQVTNIFDEARGLGLNTALAGWFHPYS